MTTLLAFSSPPEPPACPDRLARLAARYRSPLLGFDLPLRLATPTGSLPLRRPPVETLRSRRAPRSNAEAVCVHSEVWSRRSPDAPSPLGPEVASSRSRSDPAVSRRFAGFLHTRAANVAVRCRPWGSLAFRRDGRVDRSIRLPLSPRREPPLEGLLRAPAPRQSPVVGYLPALLALSLLLLRSTAVSSCRVCSLRVSPMRSEVFLRSPSGVRPTRRFLRVSGPSFLGFSSLRGLLSRELGSRAAREREPRIRSGSTDRAPSR